MELMDKQIYRSKLSDLKHMMTNYGLSTDSISQYMKEMENFHVTSPLVGRFSTGKSTLINALLGRKVLAENTMPETSIPTEIIYGTQDAAMLVKKDLDSRKIVNSKIISMDEVQAGHFNINEWSALRLTINNEFLKTVSSVRIVDMPGFGTNIELHNKAINEYLPESRAYILTFQARNSVIEQDTLDFFKTMKFYDMPVYVLVTKSRTVSPDELNQCVANLKDQLASDLGLTDVPVYCTNARGKVIDVDGFKIVLRELEKQSGDLFKKEAQEKTLEYGLLLKNYLQTAIEKAGCTASDLEGEKEKRQKHLEELNNKLTEEKANFGKQIPRCVQNIVGNISLALEDYATRFADNAMEGCKEKIKFEINQIVQEKVAEGIRNTFTPLQQEYLNRISSMIRMEEPQIDVNTQGNKLSGIDLVDIDLSKEVIKKALMTLISDIGLKIPVPVVKIMALALAFAIKIFEDSSKRKQAREEIINEFRSKYVPKVADRVADDIESAIRKQMDSINEALENKANVQIRAEQKALDDLIQKSKVEKEEREEYIAQLHIDLDKVNAVMA